MDQEQEGVGLNMFLRILKEAVGQILHLQNGEAFLSWMRVEATRRFPEVFAGLPDRVRRALATELGRQIWNATPIPRRDFRPMPLPRPKTADPCPCRSGRTYERCCANAPAVPGLTPELMWALVVGELPLEPAAALAEEGGIPRPYLGIVARRLVEAGQPMRAQRFLERLFEEPEVLARSDMDTLDALLEAYEKLNLNEEMRSFVQRFTQGFLGAEEQ
ncbi:MAG TPA: SEC-C metal-binding domain-containing protein [Thermoanaerobaculia bacterium]|nr:SEC-C metal-binding domain-containing protein [Thermoanaerobaculia bacterium]